MTKNSAKLLILIIALLIGSHESLAQRTSSNVKTRLANSLVQTTSFVYPAAAIEGGTKELGMAMSEKFKTALSNSMYSRIDGDINLSAERKASAKAKVPMLVDKINERLTMIVTRDLNVSQWIRELLTHSFSTQFTVAELRKLDNFVKSPNGKIFLAKVRKQTLEDISDSDVQVKIGESDVPEIEAFLKTPLGTKFVNVFSLDDSDKFLDKKLETWTAAMMKNLDYESEQGEIHRLIETFVKENL